MRTTTKIITGIFLSIFILSILHIIFYSFTDRKHYQFYSSGHSIHIPQTGTTGINIEPYRVLVFESERTDGSKYDYRFNSDEGGLFIQTASTIDKDKKLFFPEILNEMIVTQTTNDTLTIKLKLDELGIKFGVVDESFQKSTEAYKRQGVTISGCYLYLHTSNVNVINKLYNIKTQVNNLIADSIKIKSDGEIVIDSCTANVIEPNVIDRYSYQKITVSNSFAKSLNLDLDRVRGWNIENCNIETRNFTGGDRNHTITLTPSEYGTIKWLPKHKDAELNIKLKGDTTKMVLSGKRETHIFAW